MNISASTSVPDAAGPVPPPASPNIATASSGSAPTHYLSAGAGLSHSFESTLADLLSAQKESEEKAEEGPKQQESKTAVTGVAIPVPPPESLPFELTMPFQQAVKAEASDAGQARFRLGLSLGTGKAVNAPAGKAASHLWSITGSSESADATSPFAFIPTAPQPPQPPATSRGTFEPGLTIVEPQAAAVPEPTPAPELPNLAFAEKFTAATASPDRATSPAAHPLAMPQTHAVRPVTGDHPAESAKSQADGVTPSPTTSLGEQDHEPKQKHGNGAGQHSSSESLPQSKDDTAPTAREEPRSGKSEFELPGSVSVSLKGPPRLESLPPAPPAQPADMSRPETEPNRLQAAQASHAPDAQTISVRVTDAGDARVELRVTEHAGELRVTVRTADPELAGSLRENLGDLVHKLEQSGFRADNWHPAQSSSSGNTQQATHAEGESQGGDHSGRQQQHPGQGQERKQKDPERAGWIEELETSFAPDSERKAPTWLPA